MRESLANQCKYFIANRDTLKESFRWDNNYIIPVCASLFASRGVVAKEVDLRRVQNLLEKETGIFSSFRGNSRLPIISMLIASNEPFQTLTKALKLFDVLKEYFNDSEYLSMLAIILADMVSVDAAPRFIKRGRNLYEHMKEDHPLLTGSEDSVFSVLMAFSEKSDNNLLLETNRIFNSLCDSFHDQEAVQSLSHLLTTVDAPCQTKCIKVNQLFSKLKAKDMKYGKGHELSVLGAAAMLPVNFDILVQDIADVDSFLSNQKGYGFLTIEKKTRLMHATMIVINDYMDHKNLKNASISAITGTLSMIAAQQAAMCAVIASNAATIAGR